MQPAHPLPWPLSRSPRSRETEQRKGKPYHPGVGTHSWTFRPRLHTGWRMAQESEPPETALLPLTRLYSPYSSLANASQVETTPSSLPSSGSTTGTKLRIR